MSYRITVKHLEAKVDTINAMLGLENVQWNTVGAVQLYRAYGATGVVRVVTDGHGVTTLAELGTMREANRFLGGMIAALRIAREVNA